MVESNKQDSKMFQITKWNAVAMWTYNSVGDVCSICKNPLNETCITCQGNQEKVQPSQCKKVIGQCNHCFHSHCIEEWVNRQNNCPLDYKEWQPMNYID